MDWNPAQKGFTRFPWFNFTILPITKKFQREIWTFPGNFGLPQIWGERKIRAFLPGPGSPNGYLLGNFPYLEAFGLNSEICGNFWKWFRPVKEIKIFP